MEGETNEVLRRKVVDGIERLVPPHTRRDVYVPGVPGKALAVIGMRRSGKTTFMWQCLADRLAAGWPREGLLYFNFEDERLAGLQVGDLQWLVETYFELYPAVRGSGRVAFFLDEIQVVTGWERFVRRLMDEEGADVFLSGSSARLLSRELATSMRGRALEVLVHPFSFREVLRHRGEEPSKSFERLPKAQRSKVQRALADYLVGGGFPEAVDANERDRAALLRSYVDVAMLRDVIERNAVSNPTVLRWMLRHLLASPAGCFSVQKFYQTLKSQGISVAKDTVHAHLEYLEDAFAIRTVSLHTASERRRMVNPRKAYPVDPAIIHLYERSGRANLGHALETVVLVELERRGAEVGYLRSASGTEVDFHARMPDGTVWLLQVCTSLGGEATLEREVRGLVDARRDHPRGKALLVTLDALPPAGLPKDIAWMPAAEWLLNAP